MTRPTPIVLVVLFLVAAAVAPIGAASAVETAGSQDEPGPANDADSIDPGERLAGVVGTRHAELEGDISERAFDVRVANVPDDDATAAVVESQVAESEARLDELEARLTTLNDSREAGEISEGRYRAEVARTTAEIRTLERQAAAIDRTAADLPRSVLAERDIDRESIQTLQNRANELDGPETADIARSVAGVDVGGPVGPAGPDSDPGPPIDVGTGSDDVIDRPSGPDSDLETPANSSRSTTLSS